MLTNTLTDTLTVIIRSHDEISTWSHCDEYLAQETLLGGKNAADTFGEVYYSDRDTFYAHCNEHLDLPNNVACFAGAISR